VQLTVRKLTLIIEVIRLSELPEKKVLKIALTKLKANAITANDTYNIRIRLLTDFLMGMIKRIEDIPKPSEQDQQRMGVVIILLSNIGQQITELVKDSLATINDWKTYTEVLENYSAELDGTLTKIFEDAIKQSDDQIEKQKELTQKAPDYSR
jgi:hypothetical protein